MIFNIRDWYWFVGGDTSKVFSSKLGNYVAITDPNYLKFANQASPTRIVSEEELLDVFAQQAPDLIVTTQKGLIAYTASVRYNKEAGGLLVSGMTVRTDRESQALINGAYAMALADSTFTTHWKVDSTTFVTLDANTMKAIGVAVGQHVSKCFTTEASTVAAILAGTITSAEQVDAAFNF